MTDQEKLIHELRRKVAMQDHLMQQLYGDLVLEKSLRQAAEAEAASYRIANQEVRNGTK